MLRVKNLFVLGLALFAAVSHAQPSPPNTPPPASSPANGITGTTTEKPQSSQSLTPPTTIDTSTAIYKDNSNTRLGLVCTLYAGSFQLRTLGIRLTKYSTMGLSNDCDEKTYNSLTQATMEAQLRAVQRPDFVIRGGVHRYLMDVNLATLPNPFIKIGGLDFSAVGTIDIGLIEFIRNPNLSSQSLVSSSQYSPFTLKSNIQYIWNLGKPVHTLVTPEGERYVMYSFTTRVIPQLKAENLAYLGPLLSMPEGWSYESYLLDKTLTVKTTAAENFEISILFDDANNMYVKIPN